MNPAFWKGRRVFLTGHTGFKGSWLSLWLQSLGAQVTGYALAPATDPALFHLAHVASGMDSITGDILDLPRLTRALRDARPEVVIHLAAQALVRESYAFPVETFATNVQGTVHLLEAIRQVGEVRAAVVVTSDKCYENHEWPWGYREDDPMGGHDPYSASKGCAELVASSYRRSFFPADRHAGHGLALATARAGNVIGGGDWARDRLVPDVLKAFQEGREVVLRNPGALRPWQHVLEPLGGYLDLARALHEEGPRHARAWNFGPWESETRTVQGLVEGLAAAWDEGEPSAAGQGARAGTRIEPDAVRHEAHHLRLDISRARQELGWRPRWTLDQCLEAVVAWHRAYLAGADLRAFTLSQIRDFETHVS